MNGVRPYGSSSTDLLLARVLENAGDRDPSRVLAQTGRPLHFDAADSLATHLDGSRPADHEAAITLAEVVAGKAGGAVAYEKAAEATAAQLFRPALRMGVGFALEGLNAVAMLGSLYEETIEDSWQESDRRLALAASDAGVVGMVEALDVDAKFKAAVATAHAGSGNTAATVAVQIEGDRPMRTELQFRADQGFVDAAGYAKLAAKELGPLYREAATKLATARSVVGEQPDTAKALQGEARKLLAEAAAVERRYLTPVMKLAHDDAAYGLGVQYAVFKAIEVYASGAAGAFDAAFARASANVRSVEPESIRIGG